VSLGAAEDAFRHLRVFGGAVVIGSPVMQRWIDRQGHPVLRVELVVQRPLAVAYTLLFRRTLG
jgi:hypothetical protein